ncbi:MAG: hypothetical protein M3280_01370 [Actinomycetota bacterium]|nr:hypothetical protein [Actinomycetota bacterium]
MQNIYCPQCRLHQPVDHLFCPRCGASLPSELVREPGGRSKAARYFAGIKVDDDDSEGAFLKVSCYLKEQTFEGPEGAVTIPGNHVRFSLWVGDSARCAMSIPETEARDLAAFIEQELGRLNGRIVARG